MALGVKLRMSSVKSVELKHCIDLKLSTVILVHLYNAIDTNKFYFFCKLNCIYINLRQST